MATGGGAATGGAAAAVATDDAPAVPVSMNVKIGLDGQYKEVAQDFIGQVFCLNWTALLQALQVSPRFLSTLKDTNLICCHVYVTNERIDSLPEDAVELARIKLEGDLTLDTLWAKLLPGNAQKMWVLITRPNIAIAGASALSAIYYVTLCAAGLAKPCYLPLA